MDELESYDYTGINNESNDNVLNFKQRWRLFVKSFWNLFNNDTSR